MPPVQFARILESDPAAFLVACRLLPADRHEEHLNPESMRRWLQKLDFRSKLYVRKNISINIGLGSVVGAMLPATSGQGFHPLAVQLPIGPAPLPQV